MDGRGRILLTRTVLQSKIYRFQLLKALKVATRLLAPNLPYWPRNHILTGRAHTIEGEAQDKLVALTTSENFETVSTYIISIGKVCLHPFPVVACCPLSSRSLNPVMSTDEP